jgi:hypothetical protein
MDPDSKVGGSNVLGVHCKFFFFPMKPSQVQAPLLAHPLGADTWWPLEHCRKRIDLWVLVELLFFFPMKLPKKYPPPVGTLEPTFLPKAAMG